MPLESKPDSESDAPDWAANGPAPRQPAGEGPPQERVRRKVRRPVREAEPRWERKERSSRHSSASSLSTYLLTGVICFTLGMLTTWLILNPPFLPDIPDTAPAPAFRGGDPEQDVPPEILARRQAAMETHRKATPIIEAFLHPSPPENPRALLRPTPGMEYNLSRYSAERTRLAAIDREVATRIASKDAFTGIPVVFANGETRTAWFEHVGDDQLLLDLDSFLGCGDLTLAELEKTTPTAPTRIRGFGRILPKNRRSPEDAPELLALRDASRQTMLLLQVDSQSAISEAVLTKLREAPRQIPILLDAARAPTPTPQSRLRVVKVHALHWLYVPGFQLAPEPDDAVDTVE